MHLTLCPACGEFELEEFVVTEDMPARPSWAPPGYVYSICGHCDEEMVTGEQSRRNKQILLASRRPSTGGPSCT